MKLETPYIIEWVAWHRMCGFDIMIADNCSAGPQTELLRRLQAAGHIHYVDSRNLEVKPQMPTYNKMLWRALMLGYAYVGFLDADEFFEVRCTKDLSGAALVREQLQMPRVDAVGYYWCTFGSGGEKNRREAPVIDRFVRRSVPDAPCNKYIKSFCRLSRLLPRMLLKPNSCMKNPHHFNVPYSRYLVDGVRHDPRNHDRGITWTTGRIRHYPLKSEEEFFLKRRRGDVYYGENAPLHEDSYWKARDLNDEWDPVDGTVLEKLSGVIGDIERSLTLV